MRETFNGFKEVLGWKITFNPIAKLLILEVILQTGLGNCPGRSGFGLTTFFTRCVLLSWQVLSDLQAAIKMALSKLASFPGGLGTRLCPNKLLNYPVNFTKLASNPGLHRSDFILQPWINLGKEGLGLSLLPNLTSNHALNFYRKTLETCV